MSSKWGKRRGSFTRKNGFPLDPQARRSHRPRALRRLDPRRTGGDSCPSRQRPSASWTGSSITPASSSLTASHTACERPARKEVRSRTSDDQTLRGEDFSWPRVKAKTWPLTRRKAPVAICGNDSALGQDERDGQAGRTRCPARMRDHIVDLSAAFVCEHEGL
jgi:hypothetical protein